jgi:uncharacterized membrane protein YeaQ/YmgE (transglycosylase-associated protein family)
MNALVPSLITGGLAGFLAGVLMHGRGAGFIGNVVVGMLGAALGGWLLRLVGYHSDDPVLQFASATFGASLLLFLAGKVKREEREA